MRRNIKRNLPGFDVVSFTDLSPSPVRRRVELATPQEPNFVDTCSRVNEDILVDVDANISTQFALDQREVSSDSDSAESSDEGESTQKTTTYGKRQQNSAKNWENVREELLKAVIESECIPDGQVCSKCGTDRASYCCIKCGIGNYFCESCVASLHRNICVFHAVEHWKVSSICCGKLIILNIVYLLNF